MDQNKSRKYNKSTSTNSFSTSLSETLIKYELQYNKEMKATAMMETRKE